jgi:glucokinase
MSRELVGAIEIGGTHVTAARVDVASRSVDPGSLLRRDLPSTGTCDELLQIIRDTVVSLARADVHRWGAAVPGPFDYERGICTIEGVGKLEALHGVDMRSMFASALQVAPEAIRFLNDADAFLLGESWAGTARGHDAVIGITLGTGLGSAFMRGGEIREAGPGVPPEGRLDLVPFRGAPVEDVISRHGLLAAYRRAGRDAADVIEIAERANAGERAALATFREFGASLGEFLGPFIEVFAPSCIVFGGSITRAWPLFTDAFRSTCAPAARVATIRVAEHVEEAPLLGAALHAIRDRPAGAS